MSAVVSDGNGVPASINYQWLANGVEIAGATGSIYMLTQAEVGKTVAVRVSYADNAGFSESRTSAATAAVANVNDAPVFSAGRYGAVTIDVAGLRDSGFGIAKTADGKYLLAGTTNTTSTAHDFLLMRVNANGVLDTTFGDQGIVRTDFSGGNDAIYADPVIQPDGRIVVAGSTARAGNINFALARYDANGALDTSFGSGGKVELDFVGGSEWINGVAIASDGKIIVAGPAQAIVNQAVNFAVARFNANGSIDTSFGQGGKNSHEVPRYNNSDAEDIPSDVALLADGKILLSGGISGRVGLMRFAANGQIDTSFGAGGHVVAPNTSFWETGIRMDVASDGRVVVAGYSDTTEIGSHDFIITRFMPDGLVDASFGTGGKISTNFASLNDRGYDVKVMPDGRIVAAGMAGFDHWSGRDNFAAVRYLANGQPDTAFGFNGRAYYEIGGYLDNVEAMYLESNGDLMLLGSSFDQDKMAYDVALARIRVDGNFDRSFGQPYAIKREGMPDVLIGTRASVSDPDVAGSGNFNGHQLTIQRKGGAVPAEDGFWLAGNRVNASAPVMVQGVAIGTMSVVDGVLRITLDAQATPDLVRGMLSTISYTRSNASASGSVQLAWRWTDETGAMADAESKVVFSDDYADVGDPRIDTTNLSMTNHWKLAGTNLYFNGADLYINASARQMNSWKTILKQTYPSGEIYGRLDTYVNTQINVRMLTLSEAVSLQGQPNRPAAYQTGTFWTSTKDPANGLRYYTINMATGAFAPASETSRYPLLVMVTN
ncbi:hypothetical protein [Solilutibacter tolerans]|uniref:hypothetical protein n=1 Tax=Solilutibacter tolerans TaxID=1604334 RepID=UPI0013F61FE1|nr:hypothetical protein [Lysobacter tolerans]